jgi:hypothetical protein
MQTAEIMLKALDEIRSPLGEFADDGIAAVTMQSMAVAVVVDRATIPIRDVQSLRESGMIAIACKSCDRMPQVGAPSPRLENESAQEAPGYCGEGLPESGRQSSTTITGLLR